MLVPHLLLLLLLSLCLMECLSGNYSRLGGGSSHRNTKELLGIVGSYFSK